MTTSNTNTHLLTLIESISCPITGAPMVDPVQGNDGHTYERSAITEWLSRNPISPSTREPMSISDLRVNAAIRYLCDQYAAGALGSPLPRAAPATLSTDQKFPISYTISKSPPSISSTIFNNTRPFLLSFSSREFDPNCSTIDSALPTDIILVLDRSGSTGLAVAAQDENNQAIEGGHSINDVLIHGAKTIAKSLRTCDRIGAISFDNIIEESFPLTEATPVNITRILDELTKIKPRASTNIWGGLEKAIRTLHERTDKSRNAAIMLLTDGQPNERPARGEVETLRRLKKSINFSSPIYFFGFGYNLERELGYDIAKCASGSVGHIPDGGMLATVFTNFLATVLCTNAVNLVATVSIENGNFNNPPILGNLPYQTISSTSFTIDVGSVQLQQARNIMLLIDGCTGNNAKLTIEYSYKVGGNLITQFPTSTLLSDVPSNDSTFLDNYLRCLVSSKIREIINYRRINQDPSTSYEDIQTFVRDSKINSPYLHDMINTLDDQIWKAALSKEPEHVNYFRKWGEFYLEQLELALIKEICPNFKDQCCKSFSSPLHSAIADHSADIFDSLPPPLPSINTQSHFGSSANTTNVPRVVSMAAYNNVAGGCFHGNGLVLLADGSTKPVKEIRRGDEILIDHDAYKAATGKTLEYEVATVSCVVETIYTGYLDPLGVIQYPSGLIITPWHPVYNAEVDDWEFPSNSTTKTPPKPSTINKQISLYTFVLDQGHMVTVDGIPCICLGHDYNIGVLAHPYFGTTAVIRDLMLIYEEWGRGHITLIPNDFKKNGIYLGDYKQKTINAIHKF